MVGSDHRKDLGKVVIGKGGWQSRHGVNEVEHLGFDRKNRGVGL